VFSLESLLSAAYPALAKAAKNVPVHARPKFLVEFVDAHPHARRLTGVAADPQASLSESDFLRTTQAMQLTKAQVARLPGASVVNFPQIRCHHHRHYHYLRHKQEVREQEVVDLASLVVRASRASLTIITRIRCGRGLRVSRTVRGSASSASSDGRKKSGSC
jgi:hypothetical protein